jgi:hypothetical protein
MTREQRDALVAALKPFEELANETEGFGDKQPLTVWACDVRAARAALQMLEALSDLPLLEGWRLVPVEPTVAMQHAAGEQLVQQYCDNRQWDDAKDAVENIDPAAMYAAMLNASPNPGEPAGGAEEAR